MKGNIGLIRCFYRICFCLAGCLPLAGGAQKGVLLPTTSFVAPYQLQITHNKTTTLVFADGIVSVDRGSADILVQKAGGVEHILRLKAGVKGFEETSLSVVTKEGKLYSFLVCYTTAPKYLNVIIDRVDSPSTEKSMQLVSVLQDIGGMSRYAGKAMAAEKNLYGRQASGAKMNFRVNGFYVKGDLMFCRLQLENRSAIDYAVQQFRFFLSEGKALGRRASQEVEIGLLHTHGAPLYVRGSQSGEWVVVLPKFTIPKRKRLVIEAMEKGGSRHLQVKVKNRHLLRAVALPGGANNF